MDWFSWLSKSSLDASLVYEYGLLLSHNELEEEDITHFDHEFLQSMGITIAKHRLEIIKLSKKHRKVFYYSPFPVNRLLSAVDKTKNCFTKYVLRLFVHRNSSAIVVVPRSSLGDRWKGAALKRSKKMMVVNQGSFLLTDGRSPVVMPSFFYGDKTNSVDNNGGVAVVGEQEDGDDDGDGYWGGDAEKVRWDTMFQDLKPT
ncbi:putative sterile alpha motif/pointed domain superfamily [Dioscorea sansibarensis]